MAHGGWTTVHASHGGFVIYPEFEDIDADHDGKLTKEDFRATLGEGWATKFTELDADNDGFISKQEYATVFGPRIVADQRYWGEMTPDEVAVTSWRLDPVK